MKTQRVSIKKLNDEGSEERLFNLSILFFEHDNGWSAQCLEYDIATQAESLGALYREVERVLTAHLGIAKEKGRIPFEGLPKAPDRYWEIFKNSDLELNRSENSLSSPYAGTLVPSIRVVENVAA